MTTFQEPNLIKCDRLYQLHRFSKDKIEDDDDFKYFRS